MRIILGCGLFEAGLAACITSFCLSPAAAFPQQSAESGGMPVDPAVQRIQQQQQALIEVIGRIQEDSELALNRYTDSALAQFNVLQETFAAQQAKDLAALDQLNRFTRNVVVVMVAGMVLSLLVIAWVPLWATSRMTKQIVELGRLRGLLTSPDARAATASWEVESALSGLEQRLLTLETAPALPGDRERQNGPKAATASRVALAVGDGSALVFLPEIAAPRWAGFRRQFANLKKVWTRARVGPRRGLS